MKIQQKGLKSLTENNSNTTNKTDKLWFHFFIIYTVIVEQTGNDLTLTSQRFSQWISGAILKSTATKNVLESYHSAFCVSSALQCLARQLLNIQETRMDFLSRCNCYCCMSGTTVNIYHQPLRIQTKNIKLS